MNPKLLQLWGTIRCVWNPWVIWWLKGCSRNYFQWSTRFENCAVDGESYELEFCLGGDWKFLALVCGLNAANSDYSCIWCKCPSVNRWDMTKVWSLTSTANGARTVDEINFQKHHQKRDMVVKDLFFQKFLLTTSLLTPFTCSCEFRMYLSTYS